MVVSPALTPGATIAVEQAPAVDPPGRNPTATPHPTFALVPAKPGRSELISAGRIPIRMSIDVPAGWEKASPAMVVRPDASPVPLSIGAWRLRQVNTFPCRWAAGIIADPSWLETAEGQARALTSWWGQDPGSPPLSNSDIAPLAGTPRQTRFAGYPAWYLEVLIPTGLDLSECDGGQLILWDSSDADARYTLGPSELNRIWVVDVDRGPIVIDAARSLAASGSQQAELQAVVDSIAFEP